MNEKRDQRARAEKLLAKLEPLIRNGVPLDSPEAINRRLEGYEKLTLDEKERFVGTMIEAVRGGDRHLDPPVAWATLKAQFVNRRHCDRIFPIRFGSQTYGSRAVSGLVLARR